MSKKRKMSGPAAVAKKKMRGGGGEGKPEKQMKDNAFETLWSRKKFDVLGKKQKKGEQKRVGLSRSLAVEKRKKTLLQEYKQQGKGNVFLDRRFGENNEDLEEDEKAIVRFQKERQSQINRKSKFTLADDDEEEETLTHGGMVLSNLDDFNDNDSMQDDDDLADLDEEAVRTLNFGGGFSSTTRDGHDTQQHKSKKEIMEDIIAKSKMHKAQKAKEKEEDQELQEKLDSDFSELVKSKALLSYRPTRKDVGKGVVLKLPSEGVQSGQTADHPPIDTEKPDDFDKLIKEMIFDIRGRAGDRVKTAEETVKEERERLEELEKKRKKRMLGAHDSDEESGESDGEPMKGSRQEKKKKKRDMSGDDLGENFVLEEEQDGPGWVEEVLARKYDNGVDSEEDGSSEEDDSGKESESGEGEGEGDSGSDEEAVEDMVDGTVSGDDFLEDDGLLVTTNNQLTDEKQDHALENSKQSDKGKRKMDVDNEIVAKDVEESVDTVLPFVINAPQTLREFRALVDHRSTEDLAIAIQRIRTCNNITLAAENRHKMQVFYNVLLQFFGSLAMQRPFSLMKINLLTRPLIELSSETPYFAAHCARQRLVHMHGQLTEKLKNPDGTSCWPSLRNLLLLRFWSMVFPPSDFRHPVMTPAVLLMAGYLMRCRVTSGRDVLVGSFLCSLLLSVLKEARRFCPEVLSFILSLLVSALPSDAKRHAISLCPAFMEELVASGSWLELKGDNCENLSSFDLDFFDLMTTDENEAVFDSDVFRFGILQNILHTLAGFVNLYGDLASFPEAFFPLLIVLRTLGKEILFPEKLENLHANLSLLIEAKLEESESLRQPLRMRIKKPTPIKQFNPRFEENFVQGRNYDPDRERAETKKLKRQVKSEAKGAARELRKDNYFLSEEKAKEKASFEEDRKEKYGRAMQFLQEQESAFKSGQLGKGKGRKRRK